jgi:flagellar basal body-associated protein FliL|tara:strand:+ start:10082 stop:10258 length:177 start_codon:yes stop_codon:yes gene_type:complete
MLEEILSNKQIWTILIILLVLFSITELLKYMNLYEGMENKEEAKTSTEHKKLTKLYNF